MFWETLWPLILGFGLAGAVQAFVSRDAMQRRLGNHRVGSVVRASGYGMVSSSCSYAASAMAKSLVTKGADYIAAMVFMFASTNLVLELGIVLIVLLGWQFAVSEFVGGLIMIVLLATLGALWLRGPDSRRGTAAAPGRRRCPRAPARSLERRRLRCHGPRELAPSRDGPTAPRTRCPMSPCSGASWSSATRWPGSWRSSCPTSVWQAVFITGHGFWTSVENALVGPFIAVISFVCSIGNVPLAAALWTGGISFGGVIAFIFADLIAFPLLLIYRRYYGTALDGAHADRLLGADVDCGTVDRAAVPSGRPRPDLSARHGCAGALLVELHHLSQPRVPGRLRCLVLALPQPGASRWRRPLRTRPCVWHGGRDGTRARVARARRNSATPSARIAAPRTSVDLAFAFDLGADLVHLALVARPPLDRGRCPRPPPPPRPWAARSAACGAVASRCSSILVASSTSSAPASGDSFADWLMFAPLYESSTRGALQVQCPR